MVLVSHGADTLVRNRLLAIRAARAKQLVKVGLAVGVPLMLHKQSLGKG